MYFTTTATLTDRNDREHTITLLCQYDAGRSARGTEPGEEPSVEVLHDGGASDLDMDDARVFDAAADAYASGNYTVVANPFKAAVAS